MLERLAQLVRADGGLLAEALRGAPDGATPHGDLVAHGPRSVGHDADLPLVVEAVREGYLLHYAPPGASRILADHDSDLALLAGDRLYALGLERLAEAGDLTAVSALADLIALCAQASAAGDDELSDAVWAAGCAEVGWGSAEALDEAKRAARAGNPEAVDRLRAAARHVVGDLALPR